LGWALAELAPLVSEAVGRDISEHEILCWLALGAACGRNAHDPLLRPVVHSFIRGVGGAVVTLSRPAGAARSKENPGAPALKSGGIRSMHARGILA